MIRTRARMFWNAQTADWRDMALLPKNEMAPKSKAPVLKKPRKIRAKWHGATEILVTKRETLMEMKAGDFGSGLNRLNALLSWWGGPRSNKEGDIETHVMRLYVVASDLQKIYDEAYRQQIETLQTSNEKLIGSLQELLRCKQPRDVIAAQSDILATRLGGASRQAKTWAETTRRVSEYCTEIALSSIGEVSRESLPRGHRPMGRPPGAAIRQDIARPSDARLNEEGRRHGLPA